MAMIKKKRKENASYVSLVESVLSDARLMPVGAGRGGGLMTNLSQFCDEKPLDSSCLQGGMVTTVLGLS